MKPVWCARCQENHTWVVEFVQLDDLNGVDHWAKCQTMAVVLELIEPAGGVRCNQNVGSPR